MLRADRMSLWKPGQRCETMIMLGKDRHTQVRVHTEHDGSGSLFGRFAKLVLEPPLEGSNNPADRVSRLRLELPPSYTDNPDRKLTDDEYTAIENDFVRLLQDNDWHTRTDLLKAAGDKNGRGELGNVLDKYLRDWAAALDTQVDDNTVGRKPVKRYRLPPPAGDDAVEEDPS